MKLQNLGLATALATSIISSSGNNNPDPFALDYAVDTEAHAGKSDTFYLNPHGYELACAEGRTTSLKVDQGELEEACRNKKNIKLPKFIYPSEVTTKIKAALRCVYRPLGNTVVFTDIKPSFLHNILNLGGIPTGKEIGYTDGWDLQNRYHTQQAYIMDRWYTGNYGSPVILIGLNTVHETGHMLGLDEKNQGISIMSIRSTDIATYFQKESWSFTQDEAAQLLKKTGNPADPKKQQDLVDTYDRCYPHIMKLNEPV